MRVVFIGASGFGLKCLSSISELECVELAGVLTGPRHFHISYSKEKPVENILHADFHLWCKQHSIECIEIDSGMKDRFIAEAFKKWNPDFILVVGWYHMIPEEILNLPSKGVAGMHASLLPKYRGGAPLVWALINGEKEAGISLFYFDKGVDTGDIIGQKAVTVRLADDIASVYSKIEAAGVSILQDFIPAIASGTAPRNSQSSIPRHETPVWPQRSPKDGNINWSAPALDNYNFIRAQTKPYPGAFTHLETESLIIWEAKLFDWKPYTGRPGEIIAIVDHGPLQGLLVATADGDVPLLLTRLQTGGLELSGLEYAKQKGIYTGMVLGGWDG